MDVERFDELMGLGGLAQNPPEWQFWLEFCEMYLAKHKIKDPIIVELGTLYGVQKRFYEELLGARHISVDSNNERTTPDIFGPTEDPATLTKLKDMLGGKPITILFIDASHIYSHVARDFNIYSPLVSDIIAFHDTEIGRGSERIKRDKDSVRFGVWKFWEEMRELSYSGEGQYENTLFLDIRQYRQARRRNSRVGIGVMIKGGEEENGLKTF